MASGPAEGQPEFLRGGAPVGPWNVVRKWTRVLPQRTTYVGKSGRIPALSRNCRSAQRADEPENPYAARLA
jgi:hypothetical protein